MASYDYRIRRGVDPISWQRFEEITRQLAMQIAPWGPELILGIARGGLFPATLLSYALRRELYPIRLTRRFEDQVVRRDPSWLVKPPAKVRNRRVLIVDEMADSGQTLLVAGLVVRDMGAADVKTAALYAHTWASPRPDYVGLLSDQLIMNPWDSEILQDGHFVQHPEYTAAIRAQDDDEQAPDSQ
ncbi:phosphoribosyltransferase [Herpetosiphon giganteus]|uniref:phosphoribosyltransferase n=1 Tax=Herpetosiphon giganteus TaxID=2029754 RepID=UPI001959052B|nr:phosphoribosyltransferase family protein [Herpetosiphon giganteus]MBM7842995.1 hypoxanthine phosphoribosyltransferase [Herpetosiphon giganteus]